MPEARSPEDRSPESRSKVQQHLVDDTHAGQRLDRALGTLLPGVPRTRIFRLIRKGEVRVNGKRAAPEQRLLAGDMVRVPPVREHSETAVRVAAGGNPRVPVALRTLINRAIIHEDERLLVLDKPAGVAVHGGSGLSFGVIEALRDLRPDETLELAHRLDRDTSGCLLVARKPAALRTLHALLRDGLVQKSYLTLVAGRWELGHKKIDVPLLTNTRVGGERTVRAGVGGKAALTEFRLIEQIAGRASLLEATLHTGRTHQIRVHAAYCQHPVAGDEKYGDAEFNAELRALGLTRMFLHAHSCSFTWPGGSEVNISVPLPAELKAVIDSLAAQRPLRSRRAMARGSRARAGSR
jgi:23S rRNA pseudouridine955/2504/2580 synthase